MDFSKRLERTNVDVDSVNIFEHRGRLSHEKLISENVDFLKNKSVLEFGVYSGKSLKWIGDTFDSFGLSKTFYGFDSFQGLPEEKLDENNPDYWQAGSFGGSDLNVARSLHPYANIIPGWFSDTLTTELAEEIKKNPIGYFHIDCDIYTSTIQVWEWIVKNDLLTDGALIVYDDWGGHYDKNVGEFECGEGKAHKEICEKYNLNFDFLYCDVLSPEDWEICSFRYVK